MSLPRHHTTVRPATVIAVNDDGTYKVLPDSGRGYGQPIDGVRPILETELAVGDRVVLIWQRPDEPIPWILVTGSTGVCQHGLSLFGSYVD